MKIVLVVLGVVLMLVAVGAEDPAEAEEEEKSEEAGEKEEKSEEAGEEEEEEEEDDDSLPEDEGKAFELKWTVQDVIDCPKNRRADTEACYNHNLYTGTIVKVPSLDECVAWRKEITPHDKNYDFKGFCLSHRRGCLYMRLVRDHGKEPAYWLKSLCAISYKQIWSEYPSEEESGSGEA